MLGNHTWVLTPLLVFAVAFVIFLLWKEPDSRSVFGPIWAQEHAGGTELHYELDRSQVDSAKADLDEVMTATVGVIHGRIDPEGLIFEPVSREGDVGIRIRGPWVEKDEIALIKAKISRLGTLRMQICAYPNYLNKAGKKIFDLTEERDRLRAWIAKDDNKDRLIADPLGGIELYHNTPSGDGGPLLGPETLKWIPHKIEGRRRADGSRTNDYDLSYSKLQNKLGGFVVTLFEDAELERMAEKGDYLLEYVPVNFDERGFTGEDLIADVVTPSTDPEGNPVVLYEITPKEADRYANLSEKNIGNQSAIILDGFLKSAPIYESRIPGRGQIRGFTPAEAFALSEDLKRGPLEFKPEFRSAQPIDSVVVVNLAIYVLFVGAAVVLVLILFGLRLRATRSAHRPSHPDSGEDPIS